MRILIAAAVAALATPLAAHAQSIEGVWSPVEWVFDGGPAQGTRLEGVQPGLYFFTGGHYSIMYVDAPEPRPMVGEDRTEAELLAAYMPFVANAGTYTLDGETLSLTLMVAKHPNAMTGGSMTAEVEWEGDDLWLSGRYLASDYNYRVRLKRLE